MSKEEEMEEEIEEDVKRILEDSKYPVTISESSQVINNETELDIALETIKRVYQKRPFAIFEFSCIWEVRLKND